MAIDIIQPLRYTIDLQSGLVQTPMRGQLMKGDKKANRVIVALTDGGKEVDLTGITVTGCFIRPPDAAEIPLTGSASGGEATVLLDDVCYAQEGYCEIDVMLTVGGTSRTILALTGYVLSKGSGAYIDVSGAIPNIDDIIAQYAEMKRVTQETQAAADKANNAASRAPYVGENGNWYIWNADTGAYVDSGSKAQGPQGPQGPAGVEIDASLKEAGKAADAKATGDALTQLNQAMGVVNYAINSDLTNPVNQRGMTQYGGDNNNESVTKTIDMWVYSKNAARKSYMYLDRNGCTFVSVGGTSFPQCKIPIPNVLRGEMVTAAVCLGDGRVFVFGGGQVLESAPASNVIIGSRINIENGVDIGLYHHANDYLIIQLHINDGKSATLRWVDLYKGYFTTESLPTHARKDYITELMECQRRFHVYETESARPNNPLDCCPPMILAAGTNAVSQGTIEANGKILFYNSTEL